MQEVYLLANPMAWLRQILSDLTFDIVTVAVLKQMSAHLWKVWFLPFIFCFIVAVGVNHDFAFVSSCFQCVQSVIKVLVLPSGQRPPPSAKFLEVFHRMKWCDGVKGLGPFISPE